VMGKGRKERIVPVGKEAMEALKAYLKDRKDLGREGPLFVNLRGGRLTSRSVGRLVKKYSKRSGVFRNHASLSTTQRYTHVSLGKLMEVYDKAHPRSFESSDRQDKGE